MHSRPRHHNIQHAPRRDGVYLSVYSKPVYKPLALIVRAVRIAGWCWGRALRGCALVVCGVVHDYIPALRLAAMRSAAHFSTDSAVQAVQFGESFIGAGNVPFFTHAQRLEPDTPNRCLR